MAGAATRGVLQKKGVLRNLQNSQENTCATVSSLIKLQAYELCEISKNTFSTEHFQTTGSGMVILLVQHMRQSYEITSKEYAPQNVLGKS